MKKIAVINDLSGMGKCSLTAAIPVISVMGVQACPLPTAVLSAQTGFGSYYYDDYTEHMEEIMKYWKQMGFRPDGIYTGFLSGAEQADKVLEFIDLFGGDEVQILTDPVMGDNGSEYPIYTEALCEKMRQLAEKASIITPNLTEALLLLYGKEKAHSLWQKMEGHTGNECKEMVQEVGMELACQYQAQVVITGIDLETDTANEKFLHMGNCIVQGNECTWVQAIKEGGSYSGTGDLFASVLSAGMVQGSDTVQSVQKAVGFISKAIHDTVIEGTDRNEGVCFERHLRELL